MSNRVHGTREQSGSADGAADRLPQPIRTSCDTSEDNGRTGCWHLLGRRTGDGRFRASRAGPRSRHTRSDFGLHRCQEPESKPGPLRRAPRPGLQRRRRAAGLRLLANARAQRRSGTDITARDPSLRRESDAADREKRRDHHDSRAAECHPRSTLRDHRAARGGAMRSERKNGHRRRRSLFTFPRRRRRPA